MRRAAGFSLIELMIAMAVGLGLVAAVSLMFASTRGARAELERTGRMVDNGRYAQDLLAEDLRLAGYWGELPLATFATVVPDPCATVPAALGWRAAAPATVPAPVVGHGDGAEPIPECLPDRLPGTDVVVVRRVATDTTPLGALAAGAPYLQASRCPSDVEPFAMATTAAGLPLRNANCTGPIDPRGLVVRLYYVARCNDCGRDAVPTLKRAELRAERLVVVPLVEGVENLRVDHGFDVDGDGVADRYLRGRSGVAGQADDDWGNVVAVRVHLLVRTAELPVGHVDRATYRLGLSGEVGPFGDGFKRTAFASAVRLVNPAGRRE
ncbi:MAG TPA: PilW family protein [Burkholderiaceae bacterium]|nr:PilW family protein [Burkholderiaceae bacterium]